MLSIEIQRRSLSDDAGKLLATRAETINDDHKRTRPLRERLIFTSPAGAEAIEDASTQGCDI